MADKSEKQKNIEYMDVISLMMILRDKHREFDFFALIDERIETLRKLGNINYRDSLRFTKSLTENFSKTTILPFESIDYNFLTRMENYMKFKGLKVNSIGIYLRNIRTIYNQAISMGLVDLSLYPFRRYKIPKGTTKHRDLTAQEIASIAKVEIKEPLMRWARDMFMLSFYLIGINMKDLMYVEKIEEGRIKYKRSKGKRDYSIKVWQEAMDIIYRYPGEKYLLNALDNYADYRSATKRINKKLKDVATLCKIEKPVSTYYGRHAWGTIANSIGVSLDSISRALGHRLVSDVTIIYVKEDQEAIDQANRRVIDYILKTPPAE